VFLDDSGLIVQVDDRLRVRRRDPSLDGRDAASVAAAAGGGLWITTLGGEVLRVDAAGQVQRQVSATPFGYPSVASGVPANGLAGAFEAHDSRTISTPRLRCWRAP
jgi:hypothetical protein